MSNVRIEIGLHPVQSEFVHSPALFRGFVGGRGAGKAIAIDTMLATCSGWKAMGEIVVGDMVYDEQGKPCRVTGVTPVMHNRPCREVEFSDGSVIVADAEHEWFTQNRRQRKSEGRGKKCVRRTSLGSIVTTDQIAKSLYDGKDRNHSIRVCEPLQCAEAVLPVKPYTLGAWLGDGTRVRPHLTSADQEIVDAIREDGYEAVPIASGKRGAADTYHLSSPGCAPSRNPLNGRMVSHPDHLLVRLKSLGVVEEKHIPLLYLRASEQQRRDLLAGLMDTDGSADEKGQCEYTSVNRRLADGVCELLVSLGIKAVVTEGRATLYGRDCGPKYRINFSTRQRVFKLERKHARACVVKSQEERLKRRYIVAVRPIPSVPVRCIEVDSPSHLYLAGRSMIPTHNSFVGSYDLLRRAKPGRLYMVVAPTYKVLKDASFRTFADHAKKLRFLKKLNLADLRATLGNGAEVLFRSAENPDGLRGPNISGCWMDEASYCCEEAYNVVIACLREAGEQGFLAATFTPKGKQHWTYKILGRNLEARRKNAELMLEGKVPTERVDPNFELFTAKTTENPFLPPEFAQILGSQYSSKMAAQELDGSFLDVGGKMFNRQWFTQMLREPPMQARWVRYWDKAATDGGGCHTCGVLMGADYNGRYYVADVIRGQWSTFQRDEIIKMIAQQDAHRFHHQVKIYIEQEPGSGGIDSLRSSIISLAGYPVFGDRPSKEKRVRAEPFAAQCLLPGTILPVKISGCEITHKFSEEIVVGDNLLTHLGEWKPVVATMNRMHAGEIVSIKPRGWTEMTVTPEHPVYCATKAGRKKRMNTPQWIKAADVRVGDYVVEAVDQEIVVKKSVDLLSYISESRLNQVGKLNSGKIDNSKIKFDEESIRYASSSSRPIRRHLEVNESLCRLLGYYVAEGSYTNREVRWSFGSHEKNWIEDTKSLIKSIFGVSGTVYTAGNATTISASSVFLVNLFKQFGHRANNKTVPGWIMKLPTHLQSSFVQGAWRGDGSATKKGDPCLSYATSSRLMASCLKMILHRLGIVPHLSISRPNGCRYSIRGKTGHSRPLFQVRASGLEYEKLTKILGVESRRNKNTRTRRSNWIENGFVYSRVNHVTRREYVGDVFNFEVADHNSYQTDTCITHNCEAGNVILIDSGGSRNWIPDFIDELESFPDGKADQVDATSGAFNKLTLGNTSRPMASPNQSMPGAAGTTGTTGTPAPPNAAMPPSAAGGAMGASPHDVYPGPGTQGRTGGASGLIGGTPGSGLLGGQPGAGNTSGLLGTTGKQGNGLLGMPGRPRG